MTNPFLITIHAQQKHPSSASVNPLFESMEKRYFYYGWEHNLPVKNHLYKSIENLHDLYDVLTNCWSVETCTSRLRHHWSKDNVTCGQCAITAFIVQDLFGGDIYEIPLAGGGVHCYNLVDGVAVDLASEQFGDKAKDLVYDNKNLQDRPFRMLEPEKEARYVALLKNVKAYTERM